MTPAEITSNTRISQLLDNYPELEDALLVIAPEFRKLKNPVLRKTVARVTSLRQAAMIAGLSPTDLVNRLRLIVGQPLLEADEEVEDRLMGEKPHWVQENKPAISYDAGDEIRSGAMPLGRVMKLLEEMSAGQVLLLITPLLPVPLLEKAREKGYSTWSSKQEHNIFHSYIMKS